MHTQEQYGIVCENIRFLRQTHRLSRTAMAKKLHITLKNLDSLESGVFPERIHVGFFFHAHESFGIPPRDLLIIRLSEQR